MMTTNWTKVEEENFQALVQRANQQSREYYSRRSQGKKASRESGPEPCQPEPCQPEPCQPEPCQPEPCQPEPVKLMAACPPMLPSPGKTHGGNRQRQNKESRPPQGGYSSGPPKPAGGMGGMLDGLLERFHLELSAETILICALVWILIEEKADIKVILALCYILLV